MSGSYFRGMLSLLLLAAGGCTPPSVVIAPAGVGIGEGIRAPIAGQAGRTVCGGFLVSSVGATFFAAPPSAAILLGAVEVEGVRPPPCAVRTTRS